MQAQVPSFNLLQQQQQQQVLTHTLAVAPAHVPANIHIGSSSNSAHNGSLFADSGLLLALAKEVGKPGFSPVGVLRGSNGSFAVVSYITKKPCSSTSSGSRLYQEIWRADVWKGRAWQNIGTFPDQDTAAKSASYALALAADVCH
jgi:hypothetical protein